MAGRDKSGVLQSRATDPNSPVTDFPWSLLCPAYAAEKHPVNFS